jgi:hypothetical protein
MEQVLPVYQVSSSPVVQPKGITHPMNFSAVTALLFCACSVLSVTNSHCAFSPCGVASAFHVRSTIFPSGVPVASTPRCEYSRSRNASAVMGGSVSRGRANAERSSLAIGRALIVCSQSASREHVAI